MRTLPAGLALGAAAIAALLVALAATPALSSLTPLEDAQPSALPTFRMSDSGSTGSELNVGVSSAGTLYVGGWSHISRSRTDGASWENINIPLAPSVGSVKPPGVNFAADRVLIVDKDTGRLIVDDTYLGCTVLRFSDDEGATWINNPLACGGGITDHQKVAVGKRTAYPDPTGQLYPNVIYACANGLSHANCGVSIDGGFAFLPAAPHGTLCAFQGTPVADLEGNLYEPSSACGGRVSVTGDNGQSWGEFAVPFDMSNDTPDLGITDDGALYFFYSDKDWKPRFVRSTDQGQSWQGPFVVPMPGLRSSVFPSIVGGDAGRIALSFYGTTDAPSGWGGNPGEAPDSVRWHGYVAVITDALAAQPTVQPVQVTPAGDPLQYGCLSKLGGGCLGNIADYMDIDVGPDGRVYAVFVDGCLPGCTSKAESDSDNGVVAIQQSGPTLRAAGAAGPLDGPSPGAQRAAHAADAVRRLVANLL